MSGYSPMFKTTALLLVVTLLTMPLAGCLDGTELIEGMVTATGEEGEGCAFINCNGKGISWTKSGTISVPANAEKLIIGSVYGTENPDLANAEIKLTSPDGTQTVILSGGRISASGFNTVDMTTPANDEAIGEYFEDVLLKDLPEEATEEDWEELFARLQGFDPENALEQLSEEVRKGLDEAIEEMEGFKDAIAATTDSCKPSDGFMVFGPQAGEWKIEASAQAEAGAFQSLVWVVPEGGDSTAIDHMAEALAESTGGFGVSRVMRQGSGEGEDPGGSWHLEQFRYPAPGTMEFYRAQAIDIVYKVVTWFVLRGLFTKAIDLVLTQAANETLISMGLFKERLKTLAIFVVATIYKEVLRHAAIAELWFWRIAYTMNSVENYCKIFYIGQIVEAGIFERYTFKNPDIILGPDDFKEMRIIGGNMAQDVIERDMWGFGSPNTSPKVGKWQIEPADLVLLKPHGQQNGDCTLETISGKTTLGSGNLTVMIATQPAKAVIPVTVGKTQKIKPREVFWGPITYREGWWYAIEGGAILFVWEEDNKYDYRVIITAPDRKWRKTLCYDDVYSNEDALKKHYIWDLKDGEVAYPFRSYAFIAHGTSPEEALYWLDQLIGSDGHERMQNELGWDYALRCTLGIKWFGKIPGCRGY